MELTVETLKMAKIANLDYSKAADYMTVAIRGFHLEMDQASHIVDVYSKIAAVSASDTNELATAMSKTASSAAAVGSSFENTTAFIALMVETTRESAENIGSALKSIISRYGELKTSPDSLIDSEGEAMSFNKVETALQSVGISMHDVNGQFRDFDDVIIELSSKWDTLDMNTQRYIATVMAGNRQQSRFIALVSDYDRLSELVEEAANADDAATLQTLKTMDSLESKIQNLKNAWQGFYANLGLEEVFKGALSAVTTLINRLNSMPKLFGKVPVIAVAMISSAIKAAKLVMDKAVSYVVKAWKKASQEIEQSLKKAGENAGQSMQQSVANGGTQAAQQIEEQRIVGWDIVQTGENKFAWTPRYNDGNNKRKASGRGKKFASGLGSVLSTVGSVGAIAAQGISDENAGLRGGAQLLAGGAQIGGAVASAIAGNWPAAISMALQSVPTLIAAIDDLRNKEDKYIAALGEKIKKQEQEVLVAKNEAKTLAQSVQKLEQLRDAQYTSNEAYEEYIEYQNTLADQYPQIVAAYDAQGNAILDYAATYTTLSEAIQTAIDKEVILAQIRIDRENAKIAKTKTIIDDLTGAITINAYDDSITTHSGKHLDAGASYTGNVLQRWGIFDFGEEKPKIPFEEIFGQTDIKVRQQDADVLYDLLKDAGLFSDEYFLEKAGFDSQKALEDSWSAIEKGNASDSVIDSFYRIIQNYFLLADEKYKVLQEQTQRLQESQQKINLKSKISKYISQLIESNNNIITGYQSEIELLLATNDTFYNFIIAKAKAANPDAPELTDEMINSATAAVIQFYTSINKDLYNSVTQILSNYGHYRNVEEMQAAALELLGAQYSDEIAELLEQYWAENISPVIENNLKLTKERLEGINNRLKAAGKIPEDEEYNGLINLILQNLQDIPSELYNIILNLVGSYTDNILNGNMWTAKQQSEFLQSAVRFLSSDSPFSTPELREKFSNLLLTTDLTDKTAVNSMYEQMAEGLEEGYQASVQFISDYADTLSININTVINELETTLQSNLESAQAIIEQQTKGIKSITDARALLDSINSFAENPFSFDEAFIYVAQLGGFVLKQDALQEALTHKLKIDNDNLNNLTLLMDDLLNKGELYTQFSSFKLEDLPSILTEGSEYNYDDVTRAFITDWINSGKDLDAFIQEYNTDYYQRVLQSQKAQRQLLLGELVEFLEIDKVLAGQTPENYEANVETFVAQAYPETIDGWEQARENLTAQLLALSEGTVDDIATTADILMKLGFDERSARDEALNLQIRNAQKQYDVLQKLLSAQQGGFIRLTAEEIEVLTKAGIEGIDNGVLETSAENFTGAVQTLVQSAIDLYNKGAITLAEQNKAIIQGSIALHPESDFNTNAFQVLASNMGNLTADSLAEITAAFGLNLGKNFDITLLDGIIYEGGNIIVNDMDAFLESLFKAADSDFKDYVKAHAHDYKITEAMQLEAMSKNVDTLISSETAIIDGAAKELQNLSKAESGKSYNLTYLTHVLGESVTNVLAGALKGAGIATLENGILKINPGQNVIDVLQHITDVITAAGLDDAEIQAAVAEIQDAIVGMLDSIINLFSNGLEGKLSNADKLNLETMAAQYGFTGELTFTETAEGLKLSAESAQELAFHLQKVAGVKGQLVFDAYAKSLQETSSSYKDIFTTEKTILQLTKELEAAEARKDKNAIASLKQQLQLAQQIALVQMSDTDSYAFMDKKLPTDFAGPTNYWDSVDKMYASLTEASKTGYLSTEDFYNMMMAANDMAAKVMEETGEKMTFMGRELDGKALTAAQFIQEGFEHLEHIDGKGLMVSLKGFGVDFAAGAQAMGGDFEKGMKEFAKTQVKLLDGLIAFMETIVAMEQLEDIDSEKDGILSFENLFSSLSDGTAYANKELIEIIQGWQENEELWKQFEQIQFTDSNNSLKSFDQWLLDAIDDGQMAEADAKRLQTILNTLYQLQKSGDWDMTDIAGTVASMQELLSNTDFEGDIQIGNMQFTVSGGYTIAYELDEEDNPIWTVEGKKFNNWEDAVKQQKLVDFGTKLTEGTFELSEKEDFVATYKLGEATIKVDSSSGDVKYLDSNNNSWDDLYSALYADWLSSLTKGTGSVDFDQFLEAKGLIRTENGEIKVNGEEMEDPAKMVEDAANKTIESIDKGTSAVEAATTATKNLTEALIKGHYAKGIGNEDYSGKNRKKEASSDGWGKEKSTAIEYYKKIAAEAAFIGTGEEVGGYTVSFNIPEKKSTAKPGRGRPDTPFDEGISNEEYTALHEQDIVTLKAQLAAIQAELDTVTASAEAAAAAAEDEKARLEALLYDKTGEAEGYKSERDIAEERLTDAETRKSELEAKVTALEGEKQDLQTRLQDMAKKSVEAEAALQSQIDTLTAERDQLKIDLADLQSQNDGFYSLWQSAYNDSGALAQENKGLRQQITSLQAKIASLDKQITALKGKLANAEEQNKLLRDAVAEYAATEINGGGQTPQPSTVPQSEPEGEPQEDYLPEISDEFSSLNILVNQLLSYLKDDITYQDVNDYAEKNGIGEIQGYKQFFAALDQMQRQGIEIVDPAYFENFTTLLQQLSSIFNDISDNVDTEAFQNFRAGISDVEISLNKLGAEAKTYLANGLNTIVRDVSNVADSLNNIKIKLPQITGSNTSDASLGKNNATGSFGNALAAGTLMGELGPELWVSHGHYYVAGQNGAEFVNLPDDAIVFNHLQTERLLGKGKAGGHGTPVTNERKATSLATGNVHGGLAMASASDTLAQLKQLRAMWEAIAKMSVTDLAKKAGSGGGGGGGGSNDNKAFIKDLQRWFTWEQRILQYEKAITEEQKKRAVLMGDQVAHGREIYKSLRNEYNALTGVIDNAAQLSKLQFDWYNHQADKISNSNILKQIFEFDEMGQIQYRGNDKPGSGLGLDILATLNNTDIYGVATGPNGEQGEKWGAKQQVDYLVKALGTDRAGLKAMLAENGNALDKNAKDADILQAFGETVDSIMSNMNSWWDGAHEEQNKMLDAQNSQNEIIQQVIDNQLSLEQRVLTALIDQAQKAIDDLQDSRDALADANQKYIDGLNDSLQKQKDMYDRNEAANDLNKLQRQLAILQRSGGSASQIRSLQQQINDQMQDAYFTAQQDQISALQEAADKQIERLDYQITLMTETLEYQKENGLLWPRVYEILAKTDEEIREFLTTNTKAYEAMSPLELHKELIAVDNEIGIFRADQEEPLAKEIGKEVATSLSQSRYHEPEEITPKENDNKNGTSSGTTTAPASTSKGGGGGGSGGGSGSGGKNNNTNTNVQNKTEYVQVTVRHIVDGKTKQTNNISVAVGTEITPSNYRLNSTKYIYLRSSPLSDFTVKKATIIALYYKEVPTTTTKGEKIRRQHSFDLGGFANGGLVDYTGPAQVHGSKSKPESFFDAQSTAILRDDVLGSINVLDSLLADVSTAGTNSLNLGTNESLSIANPVININVDKIANDYDAKRAGQLAFDEMVKIARQSGNRSLSRR